MNHRFNSTVKERIAVAIMFLLVIFLFSLANRDTEKLIELHRRPTVSIDQQPSHTATISFSETDPDAKRP